ncbi:DNA polymerase III subunit epsilon [Anaerolineales bacterium]|nr:DNA polymerase III subunit epsilon [Anaerolineales bacterium]
MNCAVLDLETTDLHAVGGGFILCAVVKPLRGKPIVFRYDEMHCRAFHEKRLVQALTDEMSKYHLWIGHNIDRFDFNFLRSRAVILGVPFPVQPMLYDTMLAFKRLGYLTVANPATGKPRANLDHVADFFNIPQLKTKVGYPNAHWRTVWGTGKERGEAMDSLADHCVRDTIMTQMIYERELPVDPVWGLRRKR